MLVALGDGANEEALGERREGEEVDQARAGGLADDGDLSGIASEGGDVVVDPLEDGDRVLQRVVAGDVMGAFFA